jgi:tetratricopeptide (TPR) repeat protein
MRHLIFISCTLTTALAAAPALCAQQPGGAPQSQQSQPASSPQKPAQQPAAGNPFPDDTSNVPLMPNAHTADQPAANLPDLDRHVPSPAEDTDPARSPDELAPAAGAPSNESSSSVPDMDKLGPKDDEETRHKGKQQDTPEFKETASNDIDVGNFELDRHNWKAALSRFQSAMVMDPENPDAFWGMAEAARHLGDFSSARSYYQKVVDYDPDSKHGKEARKALKDPEIANAQAAKIPPPQPQK